MVGIYPRQSLFKKDSLSIEQQVNACIKLCETNDWEYKVYDKDKGYSGKNLNRPSFEELMNDVRAGEIDKILCYKFDRISRDIRDFSALLVELQSLNCDFISISENFDTSTPIGRAMVYICMVFAQMERENISQRIHDNYYYRTELGFWGGGPAPYGYRLKRIEYKGKKHTVLEPDPLESPVVKKIYEWYLTPSGSATTTLNKLRDAKFLTRKGKNWTSRVLMDVLSKPLYAPNDMNMYNYLRELEANITNPVDEFDGKASLDLYGKKDANDSKHKRCREIKNMYCNISSHKALVDSDTWIRVQEKRTALLRVPARSGTGKNSWFTGLMKCAVCGRSVSYTNSRGTMGYYICSSRKNSGWDSCTMKPASKKLTDPSLLQSIIVHYTKPEVIKKLNQATLKVDSRKPESDKQLNDLMIQQSKIQQSIDNLLSSLEHGNDVLIKYVNDKIVELDKQMRQIDNAIREYHTHHSSNKELKHQLRSIAEIINDIPDKLENGTFDEIRDLCHLLIKQIIFQEDGKINIEFTI